MTEQTTPSNSLIILSGNTLTLPDGRSFRCGVGRSGIAIKQKEGDGITPIGDWPLRLVMYRPDKLAPPRTSLPLRGIEPSDGWVDEPTDENYNKLVKLPYSASHENLWRTDDLYDLLIVIGYNDAPVEKGKGSAIFLHVARPDYSPSDGCATCSLADLQEIVELCSPQTILRIR